jgi:selenocysteine lyase/cysteine desulfurase
MINNKDDTVRISLYFYNTYEEVDYFISVLKEKDKIIKFVNN